MVREYSLDREKLKSYIKDNLDELVDRAGWSVETEYIEKISGNKVINLVTEVDLGITLRGEEWLKEE